MPFFHLGPRIEVYRNRSSRALHVEDNTIHVRRRPGYSNLSVILRSSSSRRRPPSPEPQIIEVEPSESYQRRYRSPAPSPEPRPREYYHSQFHHNIPTPQLPTVPAVAPAAGPSVGDLTARNAALEAEMRELRDQFRSSRIREEMLPRRCDGCGCTAVACQCGVLRSAMRPGWDTRSEYSSMSPGAASGGSNLRFDAARDINFEIREPRAEARQRVRWVDEMDWD